MKKSSFIPLILASFVGVLAALQVDRYLDSREDRSTLDLTSRSSGYQPVNYASETEALPAPVDFRQAASKVSSSVVSVDQYRRFSPYFSNRVVEARVGSGSGVILSEDGVIVTNNHVVEDAERVNVRLSDGRSVEAQVLGRDPRSDLAVIKVKTQNLTPIELGVSRDVQVGQWVLAVGNPLGFDNTVSVGVVSSLKRNLPVGQQGLVDAIQTDAAINPGNSGGALCNAQGQLIGINTAIASNTGQSVGIGFAIPVDRVKTVVNDIVKHGYARYAGLGISYDPRLDGQLGNPQLRREIAEATGAANSEQVPKNGILVRSSMGSAAQAGIRDLDIILSVDNQDVDGTFDLNRVLIPHKPGDTVTVKFWSKGQTKTAKLTLQEIRPSEPL